MHSGQKNGKKEREEYAKGVDCGDGEDDEEEKDRRKRKRENEHKARTNEESESLGHLPGAQSLSHSQLKSEIEVETNAAADRDDVDAIELDHSRVSRHSAIEKKQKLSESLHPDDVDLLLQKCGYPSSFFQNVLGTCVNALKTIIINVSVHTYIEIEIFTIVPAYKCIHTYTRVGGASDLSALFEELNEFEQFSSSFDYDGHYDDDGVGNGADDENEEEGESATTFVDVEDGELRSNSPKDLPANDVDHDCVDNNREEKGKKDREEGKKGRHLSDEKKSKCRAKAGNEGDTNDRDDDSDTGDDDDNEEYDSNFTSAIRKNTGRRSSKAPASFRHTTKTANTGVHFPVPSTSEMNEVIVMHELMVQVSQATGMSLEELVSISYSA